MSAGYHQAKRALAVIGCVELALAILILLGLLATIGSQVFSRYVLGVPLIWVEELASYLLIWLGFSAAAFAHKQQRHVRIAVLAGIRSDRLRLWLVLFAEAVVIVFALIILWHVPGPMAIEARSTSIGLPVDIARHWFFSVPLTIGMVSMMATSLYYLLLGLKRLPAGEPPGPVLGMFGDHEDAETEAIEQALKVRAE